jgi:hypothetical protein
MKDKMFNARVGTSLTLAVLLLLSPFFVAAQEAAPAQQEKPAEQMDQPGMMGKERRATMRAQMQQRRERMKKMRQEMNQELQKQMTALQEHAKMMDGITDEKQLLEALKKHQQMSDAVLETLFKQRERMHEQMKASQQEMRGRKEKGQPAEKSGTE